MICLVPIAAFKLLGSKKDQAIKINKIRQHSRYTNYIAAKNKIGDLKSLLEFILHVILEKKYNKLRNRVQLKLNERNNTYLLQQSNKKLTATIG